MSSIPQFRYTMPTVQECKLHVDDRGSVHCVLDRLDEFGIKRTYLVENFSKGMIRAWHGHKVGATGMTVIHGAAKIMAKDMDTDRVVRTEVLSDRKPSVFWIPPGYYNGAMSLVDGTKILVYSTVSFDEVVHDNFRDTLSSAELDLFGVKNR